jgi:2-methylisocitrate lyase-like PEP mutase family enzyme
MAPHFDSLHKSGHLVLLANVYDGITARKISSLTTCHALTTSSYSVAEAAGLTDDEMDMETNLSAAKIISKIANDLNKPLTVGFQGGYGEGLEDKDNASRKMMTVEEGAERVERAVRAAREAGSADFLVNAPVDILTVGGDIEEAIERGTAYLAPGVSNVFVWGRSRRGKVAGGGLKRDEVVKLVEAFEGRSNVMVRLGELCDDITLQDSGCKNKNRNRFICEGCVTNPEQALLCVISGLNRLYIGTGTRIAKVLHIRWRGNSAPVSVRAGGQNFAKFF